ncbi:hypothetical protein Tco_0659761 [Tanacetum coccineum]
MLQKSQHKVGEFIGGGGGDVAADGGGSVVLVMERARGGAWTSGSSRSGGGECFGARPEFWPEMVVAPEYSPESMAAAVVVGG